MKIAFTICSNNYLAHAKTLGNSLMAHNSDYKFIICLVDELSAEIDYSFFQPYTIVPVKEIGIPDFDTLWKKYNIVELNTCVKASFFKYLFRQYKDAAFALYLDPDIMVFHSLRELEANFNDADVLLTPHILSPIPLDGMLPNENIFLNYGTYNLGFIGLKNNSNNVDGFLNWWEERTLKLGHIDIAGGVFVDQLWVNLVPVFYDKVKVLKALGYNVAPWNLHERHKITASGNGYLMEDNTPLAFYHFSSNLSGAHYRYSAFNTPIIKTLNDIYQSNLKNNKYLQLKTVACYYVVQRKQFIAQMAKEQPGLTKLRQNMASFAKQVLPPFIIKTLKGITR